MQKNAFQIVEVREGKDSDVGWISLDYCQRV